MKECPKCKGYGIIGDAVPDILRGRGAIFSSNECDMCHGSGEVQMTNEEYLRSLNTEQLADLMSRIVGCSNCPIPKDGRSCMGTYSGCWHEIIKWLKQPHTVKE